MTAGALANPLKGEAELVLGDGRAFTLRFDYDGLCSAQKASGLPFGKMAAELGEGASMETMLGLLRGGLKRHHPEVDVEDAQAMLVADFQACMEAIGEGMTSAMGRPGGAGSGPPTGRAAPNRGTSTRSSKAGAKRG